MKFSEDWLAVVAGLLFFTLSLGAFAGADVLGWAVSTSVWTSLSKALAPASKQYAGLPDVQEAKALQDTKFTEELGRMEYEPLLPAEKKLIAWSLIPGTGQLVLLAGVSHFWRGA